jgi:hypothetical protein
MDSKHVERTQDLPKVCFAHSIHWQVSSPEMSRQTVYQALYHVTVVYLPFVAAAAVFAVAYHLKKQADIERPLKGFPLVGLEEDGLSPKDAWMKHGHRVMAKGLKAHQSAFQVMTGTGPKVRKRLGYSLRIRCECGKMFRR